MPVQLTSISNTQSFGVWLERTNQALLVISTNVITTGLGSQGALTNGNGFVNGTFGAVTLVANTARGGNATTSSVMAISSNLTVNTTVLVGNATSNVTLGYTGANSLVYARTNTDGRVLVSAQNKSAGVSAVTAFVAESDAATGTVNFAEFGITGSGFSNSLFTVVGPLAGYIHSTNGAMAVGTTSAQPLVFYTGGKLAANERMRVTPTGNVGIGNTNPDAKLTVTGTANVSGAVQFGSTLSVAGNLSTVGTFTINSIAQAYSTSYSISTTALQTIDSFALASYRSAEYLIQISDGATNHQTTKILVTHNGTTTLSTEYGTLTTNTSMGTFTTDISTGSVRLRMTPTIAPATLKLYRTMITA